MTRRKLFSLKFHSGSLSMGGRRS